MHFRYVQKLTVGNNGAITSGALPTTLKRCPSLQILSKQTSTSNISSTNLNRTTKYANKATEKTEQVFPSCVRSKSLPPNDKLQRNIKDFNCYGKKSSVLNLSLNFNSCQQQKRKYSSFIEKIKSFFSFGSSKTNEEMEKQSEIEYFPLKMQQDFFSADRICKDMPEMRILKLQRDYYTKHGKFGKEKVLNLKLHQFEDERIQINQVQFNENQVIEENQVKIEEKENEIKLQELNNKIIIKEPKNQLPEEIKVEKSVLKIQNQKKSLDSNESNEKFESNDIVLVTDKDRRLIGCKYSSQIMDITDEDNKSIMVNLKPPQRNYQKSLNYGGFDPENDHTVYATEQITSIRKKTTLARSIKIFVSDRLQPILTENVQRKRNVETVNILEMGTKSCDEKCLRVEEENNEEVEEINTNEKVDEKINSVNLEDKMVNLEDKMVNLQDKMVNETRNVVENQPSIMNTLKRFNKNKEDIFIRNENIKNDNVKMKFNFKNNHLVYKSWNYPKLDKSYENVTLESLCTNKLWTDYKQQETTSTNITTSTNTSRMTGLNTRTTSTTTSTTTTECQRKLKKQLLSINYNEKSKGVKKDKIGLLLANLSMEELRRIEEAVDDLEDHVSRIPQIVEKVNFIPADVLEELENVEDEIKKEKEEKINLVKLKRCESTERKVTPIKFFEERKVKPIQLLEEELKKPKPITFDKLSQLVSTQSQVKEEIVNKEIVNKEEVNEMKDNKVNVESEKIGEVQFKVVEENEKKPFVQFKFKEHVESIQEYQPKSIKIDVDPEKITVSKQSGNVKCNLEQKQEEKIEYPKSNFEKRREEERKMESDENDNPKGTEATKKVDQPKPFNVLSFDYKQDDKKLGVKFFDPVIKQKEKTKSVPKELKQSKLVTPEPLAYQIGGGHSLLCQIKNLQDAKMKNTMRDSMRFMEQVREQLRWDFGDTYTKEVIHVNPDLKTSTTRILPHDPTTPYSQICIKLNDFRIISVQADVRKKDGQMIRGLLKDQGKKLLCPYQNLGGVQKRDFNKNIDKTNYSFLERNGIKISKNLQTEPRLTSKSLKIEHNTLTIGRNLNNFWGKKKTVTGILSSLFNKKKLANTEKIEAVVSKPIEIKEPICRKMNQKESEKESEKEPDIVCKTIIDKEESKKICETPEDVKQIILENQIQEKILKKKKERIQERKLKAKLKKPDGYCPLDKKKLSEAEEDELEAKKIETEMRLNHENQLILTHDKIMSSNPNERAKLAKMIAMKEKEEEEKIIEQQRSCKIPYCNPYVIDTALLSPFSIKCYDNKKHLTNFERGILKEKEFFADFKKFRPHENLQENCCFQKIIEKRATCKINRKSNYFCNKTKRQKHQFNVSIPIISIRNKRIQDYLKKPTKTGSKFATKADGGDPCNSSTTPCDSPPSSGTSGSGRSPGSSSGSSGSKSSGSTGSKKNPNQPQQKKVATASEEKLKVKRRIAPRCPKKEAAQAKLLPTPPAQKKRTPKARVMEILGDAYSKHRARKCGPIKKKKCEAKRNIKVYSACEKKKMDKEKVEEEEKIRKEKEEKAKAYRELVHSVWKPQKINLDDNICCKKKTKSSSPCTNQQVLGLRSKDPSDHVIKPDLGAKYQSPRYEKASISSDSGKKCERKRTERKKSSRKKSKEEEEESEKPLVYPSICDAKKGDCD